MKNKLYLGKGIYISLLHSRKKNQYKIKLEFYDITGNIARREIDYCNTYIDAIYHFNHLRDKYFCLF